MTTPDAPGNAALDALAGRVMEANADFGMRLGGRHFPSVEFDRLWQAVLAYSAAIKGLKWLHRDVAREISGLREYLELECNKTPSEVLWRAERMACILFADYDPHFEGHEAPDPEEP